MRALIQRVTKSSVEVEGKIVGQIDNGLNLLLGFTETDTKEDVEYTAGKIARMRIFSDEKGKMNLSLQDTGGQILAVSQFTLYANCRKGNRPSFTDSSAPEKAERLYDYFTFYLSENYGIGVEKGIFGADMKVSIENDGPVTIFFDSEIRNTPR